MSPQLKAQIAALIADGRTNAEIAKEFELDGRLVQGMRQSSILSGVMKNRPKTSIPDGMSPLSEPTPPPPLADPMPPPKVEAPAPAAPPLTPAAPRPAAVPQAVRAPASPPQPSDGFVGGRQDSSVAEGFASGSQTRYQVERTVPMDGYLGVHPAPFTLETLGKLYGSGTYRITRFETGRPPHVIPDVCIGPSSGPPTYPGKDERERGHRDPRRTFADAEGAGAVLDRFARPYVAPSADVGAAAIQTLGTIQLEAMREKAKNNPDVFLKDFYTSQQARDEQRRVDDEERWRRRMEEEDRRHGRDLEKIRAESEARLAAAKAERDAMLALEDKKMEVFKAELKAREERMKEDLARSERATKEMRDSLQEQMNDTKANMDKEHELRLQMLNREHEYKAEMLKLQEKVMKEGNQDAFVGALERILGEVGGHIREIVELKKLEAMSPEAQAAAMQKGAVNGNLREPPRKVLPPQEKPPVALAGTGGNGSQAKQEENVEQIIRESLAKPELRGIVAEWVGHVKSGTTPAMFANMFVEFMRDPEDHKLRKSCSSFATFMAKRDWAAMYPVLKPILSKEEIEVFETPAAADFYETFRACVVESVNAYWAEFLAAQEEAKAKAAQAQAEKKEAVPVGA